MNDQVSHVLISLVLFMTSHCLINAQFLGGTNDGFGFGIFTQAKPLYQGGGNDGFGIASFESDGSIYTGTTTGGDGFSTSDFMNEESLYRGGENDGYSRGDYLYYHAWTGLVGSGWLIAGNWTDNVIPTESMRVRIPGSAPAMPGINAGIFKIGTSAGATYTCKELWIESGATVTGRMTAFIENHNSIIIEGLFRWRNQTVQSFICQPGSHLVIRQGGILTTDF